MDVEQNRLVRSLDVVPEEERGDFTPVPAELHEEAECALAGRDEVMIAKAAGGRLAAWAAAERKKRKKARTRNKQSRVSRRKNRGK